MIEPCALRGFDLFTGLREEELTEIARFCNHRTYEKDAIIFTGGGWTPDIYLLEAGTVAIQIEFVIYEYEIKSVIYTVRKGETFGWSTLVPPHRLAASAQCLEKDDVITINGADLLKFLKHNNFIGHMIMRNLSGIISSRLCCTTAALRYEIQKLIKK
jgi:CRP/FNR family transcriptional regulator, cyclic AMP receptor protein